MKLLIVFNPTAGKGDNDAILNDIKQQIKHQKLNGDIYLTTGENDDEHIDTKLSKGNYTHIAAAGGDGTISMVAKHARQYNLPLGILPIGTSNGLATDLYIPENPLEAFQVIIDAKFHVNLDTIIVNEKYPLIHLGDVGSNANLLARDEKSSDSKIQQALSAIEELKDDNDFKYKITTEEGEWEGSASMISFCNAKRYGTGIPLTKEGKPNDGFFELVVFEEIQISTLVNSVLAKFDETFLDKENTIIITTDNATINLKSKHLIQVDGELVGDCDFLS